MSDGGTPIVKYENRLDVAFDVPNGGVVQDDKAARKALLDAVAAIPSAALNAMRSFRLTVVA